MIKLYNLGSIVTLLLLVISSTTFAQSYKSSKSTSSSSYIYHLSEPWEISLTSAQGYILSSSGTNATVVGAEAYYQYNKNIQIGGSLGLVSGSGSSTTNFKLLGMYNLNDDIKESVFLYGGFGSLNISGSNQSGIILGAGKRFPLWNKVNWAPKLEFASVSGNSVITIMPINITIFVSL